MDSEDWVEFRKAKRARIEADKFARLKNAEKRDDGKWMKHSRYHWSRKVGRYRLDYWPTTSKWMFKNIVRKGLDHMWEVINGPAS